MLLGRFFFFISHCQASRCFLAQQNEAGPEKGFLGFLCSYSEDVEGLATGSSGLLESVSKKVALSDCVYLHSCLRQLEGKMMSCWKRLLLLTVAVDEGCEYDI